MTEKQGKTRAQLEKCVEAVNDRGHKISFVALNDSHAQYCWSLALDVSRKLYPDAPDLKIVRSAIPMLARPESRGRITFWSMDRLTMRSPTGRKDAVVVDHAIEPQEVVFLGLDSGRDVLAYLYPEPLMRMIRRQDEKWAVTHTFDRFTVERTDPMILFPPQEIGRVDG